MTIERKLQEFKEIVRQSKRIVGFTGAGISTDSGIPDYRSQGGIWEKFQPVYFDEFLNDKRKRILYWQRKQEMWGPLNAARPNEGHHFFKKLYDEKKLHGLITQNIDGLHQKSGVPDDLMVDLHGNTLEVVCLECGAIVPAADIFGDLDLSQGVPKCEKCGGLLKPNTISFGQSLKQEDIVRAQELCLDCDLMIVMGSTLVVQPAASFPMIARQNGAKLVIVNLSSTPLDSEANLVFSMKIGEFLVSVNGE